MDVSVIIPCFKSGNYVIEAVDSVLAQKGESHLLEVIVVDDHNDDAETLNALELLKSNYSNDFVRVIRNQGERGPGAARNCGIQKSKGDWIAFLDADDKYTEYSLDMRYKAAKQFPQCGWIGADFSIWQDGEEIEGTSFFRNKPLLSEPLKEAYQYNKTVLIEKPIDELLLTGLTNTISSMIRKDLLEKIGGFDNSFRLQQDYHLFLRLSVVAKKFVFVPRICSFYRIHDENSTKSELNTVRWRTKVLESLLSENFFKEYWPLLINNIAVHYLGLCYGYREMGNYSEARKMALCAIRYRPLTVKNWKCLMASLARL